jgi:hypothetical protein
MLGSRLAIPIVTAIAVALAAPGVASAQLIFDRGNDIWAANDDGSNPHPLVLAAPLGMDAGLGSPAVAPNGDALLFRGTTLRNAYAGNSQDFYGENADGAYVLQDGAVRRLSAPPAASPMAWTTGDLVPEPAPGGAYVYERDSCTEQLFNIEYSLFWGAFCKSELRSSSLAAGAAGSASFATPCDEAGEGGPGDPSPDPTDGSLRVVYVGCGTETEPFTTRGELIVGEPGGVATPIAYGADLPYGNAFAGFADPSFSPDGRLIVAYDYGGTDYADTPEQAAGIYLFDPASPGSMRLLLSAPEASGGEYETLASPRFAGPNTIVFVAGGSVWSVPASCDECSMADATKLFAGGPNAAEQAFSVAWTAVNVAPASVYPSQGPAGGSPSSPSSPTRQPQPRHESERHGGTLALTLARLHARPLRRLLAKGLAVRARCSSACRLALTLTVDTRTARRYGLLGHSHRGHRRARLPRHGQGGAVVVGRVRLKLSAGKLTGARVRFTPRARRSLRRARSLKLRLSGVASASGLAPASAARILKVRR